jgi:hypothetical protein
MPFGRGLVKRLSAEGSTIPIRAFSSSDRYSVPANEHSSGIDRRAVWRGDPRLTHASARRPAGGTLQLSNAAILDWARAPIGEVSSDVAGEIHKVVSKGSVLLYVLYASDTFIRH